MSHAHHQVARDAADAGVARLVWTLAVIPPLLALIQALVNAHGYRSATVAVVVWPAVLAAGYWLVPRLGTGGLNRRETAATIAVAVAAVAAAGAVNRANDAMGGVDLAVFGTVGLLVLLVLSRPAWVWLSAALLVLAVHGALLGRAAAPRLIEPAELAAADYIMAGTLVTFAALRSALAAHVRAAARQAALASRLESERAAAAAVERERQGRLAVLEREALPLLRAIADGTADPADPGVRERCFRQAAVLRQSLAGTAPGGELATGLEPALRSAAERGLTVAVQLIDEPGAPPPVTRAVIAAVDAVLRALPPHPVVLTVLAADDDTELYLTFSRPLRTPADLTRCGRGLPAAAGWQAAVSDAEDGGGALEIRWRRDGADCRV